MKFIRYLFLCFIVGCATQPVTNVSPSFAGYEKYHLHSRNAYWELISPLPMDKRYIELNEDQQKIVKNYYSDLIENDSPPYPVSGTQKLYKAFIKEQHTISVRGYDRVFGVSRDYNPSINRGNIVAIATISKSGKTEKVEILESPANKLKRAIIRILHDTEFDPGTCDGEPCQREFLFQIHSGGIKGWREETYTVYPPTN